MVGGGKGSQFMHLLRNALHLTLQARCHHCPGCHFELKQVGFTATFRPPQCLLTSRNTFFSIFRAGLLEPHGLNLAHGIIATFSRQYACADATPCLPNFTLPCLLQWSSEGGPRRAHDFRVFCEEPLTKLHKYETILVLTHRLTASASFF
jgi:hypothetical protein